jgi:hypothetical protein
VIIQNREQTSQPREEAATPWLESAHYRQLLRLLYGPGADNERLWDDSYIPEIEEALSGISARQAAVMRARLLGRGLEQIAASFNSTRERIRQMENQALRRLRHRPRLRVIYRLRARLCEYPKHPKGGLRLAKPLLCLNCHQPQDQSTRFPPCPVRFAQPRQQGESPPTGAANT